MRIFVLIMGMVASLLACAQDTAQYQEGKHYQAIETPVRTADPNKIEVTEVFWYGCGHCFQFAPMVQAWAPKLPDDVNLRHSPAIWNKAMETHARIYYTAKALGKLDEMHMDIFAAMHNEGKKLTSEDEIAQLFGRYDVDKETFQKTFNSFGVKSQVQQADARQRGYGISGTPTLVVDGKYRISGRNLDGGHPEMLRVAEFLVDKIRQKK